MNMIKYLVIFFFLSLFLSGTGCKKNDDDDQNVKAAFEYSLIDTVPGKVAFTNRSSNAQTYEWDFGDGKFSTQKDPLHLYLQNDTYIVKLVAFGNQKTASVQDTIIISNIP